MLCTYCGSETELTKLSNGGTMQTIKELVDLMNAMVACEGFISLDMDEVTSNPKRRIHMKVEVFKENFSAYVTESFDRDMDKLSVVVGKTEVFALDYKEQNV